MAAAQIISAPPTLLAPPSSLPINLSSSASLDQLVPKCSKEFNWSMHLTNCHPLWLPGQMVNTSCTLSKAENQAKKYPFLCNNNTLRSTEALARRLDIRNLDMVDCATISLTSHQIFCVFNIAYNCKNNTCKDLFTVS